MQFEEDIIMGIVCYLEIPILLFSESHQIFLPLWTCCSGHLVEMESCSGLWHLASFPEHHISEVCPQYGECQSFPPLGEMNSCRILAKVKWHQACQTAWSRA